jgi:hypothetical protein
MDAGVSKTEYVAVTASPFSGRSKARVVIFSMASSTGPLTESSRRLEFLFDGNRLNSIIAGASAAELITGPPVLV